MLNTELIVAIASFALVTSITPGPNNIMLTASGANFGFVKTLPHILGIVVGVALLNLGIGLGLGTVFQQFPVFQQLLKIAGSLYLLWLAYKLLRFNYVATTDLDNAKPFSCLQALAFQTINPKAWVMVISANASFSLVGEQYWPSVWLIISLFLLIGPPSIMVWTVFGQIIRLYLARPQFLKCFNVAMASLTALCVAFIWFEAI